MVPGVFTIDRPCRAASPERGCTSATYPSGTAIATPVGTSARSPGPRVTSTAVTRSAPASPGWAYAGSGRSGSRRTTGTGSSTRRTLVRPGSGRIRSVDAAAYDERLTVPLRWWVQGTMLVATLWLALIVAVPASAAWACTGLALACLATLLISYGGARVSVRDGWLRAGRARIEAEHVGEVAALDAEETRRVAGPQADARAYLLLRPYLKRAVRVEITDPADPAPYWLVSSRHPDELAEALRELTRSTR